MMFGFGKIAETLNLDLSIPGVEDAIAYACEDLDQFGLVDVKNQFIVRPVLPDARRYATHSLREMWPELRSGDLEPDDEEFLRGLAAVSLTEADDWAGPRRVITMEVFEHLGWDWDRGKSLNHLAVTDRYAFTKSIIPLGDQHTVRMRWAGAVRVGDEIGGSLGEARDHLAVGRARAAGCIAGVELERRLKTLCAETGAAVETKLPTLADYNRALFNHRVYRKHVWRGIDELADLRNLCAHVLDAEPTVDEARTLVDGVEAALRQLEETGTVTGGDA
jgi:hypothetical protein